MQYILIYICIFFGINLSHAQTKSELFQKAEFDYCDNNIPSAIKHLIRYKTLSEYSKYGLLIDYKLGDLYLEIQDTAKAIEYYEKALTYKKPHYGYNYKRYSCNFFPRLDIKPHSDLSVKLAYIYAGKKDFERVKTYLHLAYNKYRPYYSGCANGWIMHRSSIQTEEAKIELIKGDTTKARNLMLDLLFVGDAPYDDVKETLYRSVKKHYTKKELQHQLSTGIKEGKIDSTGKSFHMVIFNHTVNVRVYTSRKETAEDVKSRLFKWYRIKEILES